MPNRPPRTPQLRFASLSVLASLLAACATGGGADTPGHGVAGTYVGSLEIENQPFAATLTLRTSGPIRVIGMLRLPAPADVEAEVDGVVIDGLLRLDVAYRSPDGCDGRIEGILDVRDVGGSLAGPVTIRDCEDPVAGRLTLVRRRAG